MMEIAQYIALSGLKEKNKRIWLFQINNSQNDGGNTLVGGANM